MFPWLKDAEDNVEMSVCVRVCVCVYVQPKYFFFQHRHLRRKYVKDVYSKSALKLCEEIKERNIYILRLVLDFTFMLNLTAGAK